MTWTPSFQSIAGRGKPRLLVTTDIVYTGSTNTTYTATSISETGTPALTGILAGMRISSIQTGSPNKVTYAKVLSKATGSTGVLTVDGWSNGTPTNGQSYTIDGWVIDLPYCYQLTETFEPDVLVHGLWRGDKGEHIETKNRGWKYSCKLDYAQFISADVLISMRPALSRDVVKQLTLVPHVDQPGFNYDVYFSQPVELARYGRSPGHKLPVFVLQGQDNLASFPLVDGYGTSFATTYGTHL